jgi:hypothetical protein
MPVASRPSSQQPVFLAQGNGVIYIKIARNDSNGNDNTLSLQELENLRIKFSDYGIANYSISNITEYPDYYLYQIYRTNITSSTDNNIKNYKFSASAYTPPVGPFTVPGGILTEYIIDSYSTNTDILNYFNPTSGLYTYGDTPNVEIIFTASAYVTPSVASQALAFTLAGVSGSTFSTGSVFTVGPGPVTITISGSTNSFIENTNLVLGFINLSVNPFNAQYIQWQFTQSVAPNSASNLTVLEPYLTSDFEYSDCNVLLNNASQNQIGSFYRRVLYDNGSIIPSNFQEILSQSAEYAEVKDYNYSARAQVLPRYDGVRTLQQNENVWTEGDIGYGEDPSVQTLVDKFAAFDWMGGADPEIQTGGAGIHITQLINSDSTLTGLTPENKNLFTVEQIFKHGSSASVYYLTSPTDVSSLQASVYDGGALYNSLMAVSGTFNLHVRPGSAPTVVVSSQTLPYFVLSGSTQISSVITASYSWAKIFDQGISINPATSYDSQSGMINFESDLFPTQQYDIIRFFPTSSIDDYYILQNDTGSALERRILSKSNDGTNFYFYLDIPITASQFPSASNDQGFRIYRRIPNETFVYINDYQAGSGFLIPGSYNPDLDYLQIARKAGLL